MAKKSRFPGAGIADVTGWILITQDEDTDERRIAWLEPFGTKKNALAFASRHGWQKPYWAIRGRITVDLQ